LADLLGHHDSHCKWSDTNVTCNVQVRTLGKYRTAGKCSQPIRFETVVNVKTFAHKKK